MNNSNCFINTKVTEPYKEGILSGLTFAVKDNIDIANIPTGYGSPSWSIANPKPVTNAICIDQLLSAGAKCVGKTHTDELAYSLIGKNHYYGAQLNTKAPTRVSGGSSSGSASAVASGAVDFAIGTDTGGSVRVPANNCGIWGYRPSHGLISVAGVLDLAPSYDTVGVLTRSGLILEKVVSVLLANKFDRKSSRSTISFLDDIFEMADISIQDALRPVCNKIKKNNDATHSALSVIAGEHANHEWLFQNSGLLLSSEIWNTFGSWVESSNPDLSPEVRGNLENFAKSLDRKDILDALIGATSFSIRLRKYLEQGHIACFTTTVDLAPKLDQLTDVFLEKYYPRVMVANAISGFSRVPQITIPVAEYNGVPAGLSFIGNYCEDQKLVSFCNDLVSRLELKSCTAHGYPHEI